MKYIIILFVLLGVFLGCHWLHMNALFTGIIMAGAALLTAAKL